MPVTEHDLADVSYPLGEKPLSDWTDEQVMKAYLDAYSAINLTEVYGTSDLRLEQATAGELADRDITIRTDTTITFTTQSSESHD